MMMSEPLHLTFVFFHVLGAILFMGNIVVSASWMAQARRNGNAHVLHFAASSVMRADKMFTIPGLILILVPGLVATGRWGGFPGAAWVELALTLFILSGVIWAAMLLRLQKKMIDLSLAAVQSNDLGEFNSVVKKWNMWNGIATLLPFLALFLMVFKPALWR